MVSAPLRPFDIFYLALLAALGFERLFELWLSAHNARLQLARGAKESGQRHYPVMAAFHGAFLVACAMERLWWRPPVLPWLSGMALAVAAAAQALRYWAVRSLGTRWNTRVIARADEPPVTSGPYRFLRHPNYLAVALELFSVPLVGAAYLTALTFSLGNVLLLAVRIPAEERALGAGYTAAFAQRRRFWPGARAVRPSGRHG